MHDNAAQSPPACFGNFSKKNFRHLNKTPEHIQHFNPKLTHYHPF
jgi:hypothetical protein